MLTYSSAIEIRPGDRVRYHGEPALVEFLASPDDPKTAWYFEEYGHGCMLIAPVFGRAFVSKPEEYPALEFVSRGELSQ
jgi:hypothetical protein